VVVAGHTMGIFRRDLSAPCRGTPHMPGFNPGAIVQLRTLSGLDRVPR
jgi:hypothetical protein